MPKEKNSAASAICVGGQGGARQLDHRADEELQVHAGLGAHVAGHLDDVLLDGLELLHVGDQRDHDLDARHAAGPDPVGRGLQDRARLHLEQAGDDHAEAHAAQAEHRVLLVQLVHRLQHPQVALALLAARLGHRHAHRQLGDVGQELVQRRVEQPDRHRQAVHRLEDPDEVLALHRQQLGQFGAPAPRRCRPGSGARPARAARPGTCARCGTARCPARRTGGPAPRPRRCRRWPGPPSAVRRRRGA